MEGPRLTGVPDAFSRGRNAKSALGGLGRRAGWVAVWAAGGLVLLCVPSAGVPCPVRWLTHVPCPSCGMTRAFRAAARAQWREAFSFHAVWAPTAALLAVAIALEVSGYLRQGRTGSALGTRAAAWIAAAWASVLVAVWLLRFLGLFGGPAT